MVQGLELLESIFGLTALVALAMTLVTAVIGSQWLRSGRGSDFVLPCAVVIGFFAGYLVLPRSFAALVPQQNQAWQWLPYFGVITALLSASLSPMARPAAWIFPLVIAACTAAAAFAPNWPIFELPPRWLHMVVACYLLIVGGPLLYLPGRVQERWMLPALACSGAITAVGIGAMVSTRLAQLAALSAGAFAAAAIVSPWLAKASDRSLRNLIAVYAVLVGSPAWLAFVEPDPPQWPLLIVPLLPLLLWIASAIRVPSAGAKIG